ncbi:MAG TPA: hypothetical protein VN634_14085 [Candidatus Limnocylindrales bacterium]|nr:hypothetical protein [Candidatus Limnocylindrales bacterium]
MRSRGHSKGRDTFEDPHVALWTAASARAQAATFHRVLRLRMPAR